MEIPVGFAQINFIFSGEGYARGAQLTVGCENPVDHTAEFIALNATNFFDAEVLTLLNQECNHKETKVKLGPNVDGQEFIRQVGVDGGKAGAGLPPNVAGLVSKRTALGGRKNRGRWFLPGLSESDQDTAGYLTVVVRDALDDALTTFKNAMEAADLPLVILHNDATAPTPITALQTQLLMATQKRRIRRAGGRRAPVLA